MATEREHDKKVVEDNDVQFFWLIATADLEIDNDEVHTALFVKDNSTMRGFQLQVGC